MIVELADRLRAEKGRLVVRVVDEMFENPFWAERFGARGRRFAEEDLGYHVDYLAQALVARDGGVMDRYARWLQSVLTSRGMCTIHLADSFARLDRAIPEHVDDALLAHTYLEAARSALLYPAGPSRELQEASAGLAERAVDRLHAEHPDWAVRWGARGRALCIEDVSYHLSYIADAMALGRPALFGAYVAWIDGFLQRRGLGRDHLVQTLDVLRQVISDDSALSESARVSIERVLVEGRS